jgi:hypothetical protein
MLSIRSAAVLVLLAGPVTASAAPRIVVAHVRGDANRALSRQLSSALCRRFECVPRSLAYTGTRPDFAKARRNGVSGIVFGAVTGRDPNRLLWLALLTTSIEPARTWSLPLRSSGLLPPRSVDAVVADVARRIGPPGPPAPPREVAPPAPPPVPPPAAEAAPAPPPPRLPPPPPPEPPSRRAEAPPPPAPGERAPAPPAARPPPPREAPAATRPWLAVEIGGHVASRELDYSGTEPAGTVTLKRLKADAIASPRARLELFPAAAATGGALAGLGAFAEYRRSVGFEVKTASETRSAQVGRLGAGLLWRLPPLTSLKLGLAPAVSYERLDATVSGGIAGLPDAHLRGFKVGSGLSIPIGSRFALLLGGGYVLWTSSGDLVKPFFPSGSASAIEAEAGFSLALHGRFSLQLLGEYSSTSTSLDPDPTGTYRASSAADRYLGGRASVRAEF